MKSLGTSEFSLLRTFEATGKEDLTEWVTKFDLLSQSKELSDHQKACVLPLLLVENAFKWFMCLTQDVKSDYSKLKEAFQKRYGPDERTKWARAANLFQQKQFETESTKNFITRLQYEAISLDITEEQLISAVISGLLPHVRKFVLQQKYDTLLDIDQSASLAELTCENLVKKAETDLLPKINKLEQKISELSVSTVDLPQMVEKNCPYMCVHKNKGKKKCSRCGRHHGKRCPARGQLCLRCNLRNHFACVCQTKVKYSSSDSMKGKSNPHVNANENPRYNRIGRNDSEREKLSLRGQSLNSSNQRCRTNKFVSAVDVSSSIFPSQTVP